MDPFIYILPSTLSRKRLGKKFPTDTMYEISIEKSEMQEGFLLDTFEDQLFHANKLLFQLGEMLLLLDLKTGWLVQQPSPENWSFIEDLDQGPLTSLLNGVAKLRAFLPIVEVKIRREDGVLLDDEKKTRARFHNLTLRCGKERIGVGITQYLRGYRQAHNDLRTNLEGQGAVSFQDAVQLYSILGIEGQGYSSKPEIRLDPAAPALQSATTIIRSFISVARQNEEGVIGDYDTEFLHDYRVSFRKVRSVLSLFKGVYNPDDTSWLKKEFAGIMQYTNMLRDLDVYLLNRKLYFDLVPEDTHKGLGILFDYFAGERKKEKKKVAKSLKASSYLKKIAGLQKLFAEDSKLTAGPKGEVHSLTFASKLVLKRYETVCKIARSIRDETEDEVVHQLRINCKKLRYLIEFFSPLFPKDEIRTLIKSLKMLQDNLGNFNDYSVQQIFLRQLLTENMAVFGNHKLKVAESVGALTAILNRLQLQERGMVMENFARFDSPKIRKMFKKLFQTKGRVDEDNSLLQQ